MTATRLSTDVTDELDAVLADGPETVYVHNPSGPVFDRLLDAAVDVEGELPTLQVLGAEGMLKERVEDFLVASTAADLEADDRLELRTLREPAYSSAIVTEDRIVALVEADELVGGLSTTDGEFVEETHDSVAADWEAAAQFAVRTPPLSRVYETLESTIGGEAREDFQGMLGALDSARGDADDLDEVTVSLLVAAHNGVLLYDISKWGEDVGIASKATFSRTKTRLEDAGLVDTEKVPIDVGRPRLRLRLADGVTPADDVSELAESAIGALSENPDT